jgi:T5SS/PEP-CTERM-associated repeat protein
MKATIKRLCWKGNFSLLLIIISTAAHAQKVWTSPNSGLWRDTNNWSGHVLPNINSFVQIQTNQSVTVTLDALTQPTNLTLQSLAIGAPTGFTNTVFLNNVGITNPLILQTGLELTNGAALLVTNSAILLQLTNDHVNIDGNFTLDSGSLDFGDITVTARVGRATSGVMTINSGLVSAGAVTVGGLTNSSGVLNLNGGTLNVATLFSVGRNPGTTGCVFVAGGQLMAVGEIVRVGDESFGQMTVSNALLWMTNLNVGRDPPSAGTFTLENGATVVISNQLAIGRFNGSTGAVFVTGGQLSGPALEIDVGREGNGQMAISNGTVQAAMMLVASEFTNTGTGLLTIAGGTLNISSNFLVGAAAFSTGQVSMTSGAVAVANPAGTAFMSVANGSVSLSGGCLTTDNLLLTNAAGTLLFNGGTLSTKGTTVANGAPFIVGDGSDAATLHLSGGTHSFANGLIISSNAALSGCGTILGTIINHGTIATNCTMMPARPVITRLARTGTTNAIYFTTVTGQTYALEFENALTDGNWIASGSCTNGSGAVAILIDTTANLASRFYRVRTQ